MSVAPAALSVGLAALSVAPVAALSGEPPAVLSAPDARALEPAARFGAEVPPDFGWVTGLTGAGALLSGCDSTVAADVSGGVGAGGGAD